MSCEDSSSSPPSSKLLYFVFTALTDLTRSTMKLTDLITLTLFPLLCHGAKQTTTERFDEYHSKFLSSAPLKLTDKSYEELTAAPRNFSMVILLTALEARFGCQLCKEFQSEWDLIGKSWAKGDKRGESRMLYGTLDFTDGKGTFQAVRSSNPIRVL